MFIFIESGYMPIIGGSEADLYGLVSDILKNQIQWNPYFSYVSEK